MKDDVMDNKTGLERGKARIVLYTVKYNSKFWVKHIPFRDYLIKNKSAVIEYEKIKMN